MSKSSWMMDPTHSCEMPRCSAIDLAEIWQSSKISSSFWSVTSGVVTVLGHPRRGASQVEKSPRLNWPIQFLMVAYDGARSPNVSVRMAYISFGALPCRGWGGPDDSSYLDVVEIVRCLTCFLSASITRKDSQFSTIAEPSFQQHYWFCPTTSGSRSG